MKKSLNDNLRRQLSFPIREMLLMIVMITMISSCSKQHSHQGEEYTCPMHPTVISDRPGSCPVCGMALVLKKDADQSGIETGDLSSVLPSTNGSVIGNIKSIHAEYKAMPVVYEARGIVTHDPKKMYTISSRISGRIEKAFLKYDYQPVTKGQRIADVYSPELITAQRELLFLLENEGTSAIMVDGAKKRLQLLGMTSRQIEHLIATRKPENTVSIFSPYNGFVLSSEPTSGPAASGTASPENNGMPGGMNESSSSAPSANSALQSPVSAVFLKEGDYVSAGQKLWTIIDHSSLRLELDIPSGESAAVKKGDRLKIDVGHGMTIETTVEFIQPFFMSNENFLKIRVSTKGMPELHIGHIINAKVEADSVAGMWLPREAVIDQGNEKLVFIREKETFKPRQVTTGIISKNKIQIIKGVASSDEVAANATFLVDSESIINVEKP